MQQCTTLCLELTEVEVFYKSGNNLRGRTDTPLFIVKRDIHLVAIVNLSHNTINSQSMEKARLDKDGLVFS